MAVGVPLTARETRGFTLLGSVIVIWVLSGFFIQNLFASSYNHPVAMTVYSVALCSLLLLIPARFRRHHLAEDLRLLRSSSPSFDGMSQLQIFCLGIIWLTAQLSYNVSLKYMSVSSNTAVSSMSSVFTFVFSILLLKRYTITALSLLAIGLSAVGILIISSVQPTGQGVHESSTGIVIAMGSCCCYGLFTTLLKKFDADGVTSVVTLFGNFGLIACTVGSVLIVLADWTGIDPFALPTDWYSIVGMTVNALVGSVLSDILLAKSVLLLNPITVSIGLSLTMPLSLFLDSVVIGGHKFKPAYAAGMLVQFASICLISVDNHKQRRV